MLFNGRTSASQADDAGSIPVARSIIKARQDVYFVGRDQAKSLHQGRQWIPQIAELLQCWNDPLTDDSNGFIRVLVDPQGNIRQTGFLELAQALDLVVEFTQR